MIDKELPFFAEVYTSSSLQYNGVSQSSSGGTYSILIGNSSYNVDINFGATTSYLSASFYYSSSTTTNSLSRSAFSVSFSFNINVAACSTGTVIGTIPYQYRPATSKTYTTNWTIRESNGDVLSTATITIHSNGNITSDTVSNGTHTVGGGGKWGSYSYTVITKMVISGSYSVV